MKHLPLGRTAVCTVVAALALTGCSAGDSGKDDSDGKIKVVTSTNVYADIARNVGGDRIDATPLIDSTSQDPHSYEATAQDRLKVKDADVVVVNGADYDHFLEDLAADSHAQVVNAVDLSGLQKGQAGHDHGSFNEHVWYDFDAMKKLTDGLEQKFASLDSEHRTDFESRAKDYDHQLDGLSADAKKIPGADKKFLATEPVPDYLLKKAGMKDSTPAEFTEAIEGESDVPAATMDQVKQLVGDKKVQLLAYNEQTSSAQTQALQGEAKDSGVPSVSFTETLPQGKDYLSWMEENISALDRAL